MSCNVNEHFTTMKTYHDLPSHQLDRTRKTIILALALFLASASVLVSAQYSEIKMGEYLHDAVAAANLAFRVVGPRNAAIEAFGTLKREGIARSDQWTRDQFRRPSNIEAHEFKSRIATCAHERNEKKKCSRKNFTLFY